MPKSSRFFTSTRAQIKETALRIQSRMQRLGYSQEKLSELCGIVGGELYSEAGQPSLRRDRIAKILMNLQIEPGSSVATAVSDAELRTLALALKCSVEWLSGRGLDDDPVVWNLLTEQERGTHILHLLEEYEERAGESIVWSEYLMCSFTTEDFMVAFHRAHFGEMDTGGMTNDKRQLVEFFNRAGYARRKRILNRNRGFRFTNIIYESELQRLVAGTGIYRSIGRAIRIASLNHLVTVLEDPTFKMSLMIVNDQGPLKAKAAWRDYETVGVLGDFLSFWNYHSGSVGWSENTRNVRHHGNLIDEMKKHTLHKTAEETIRYLKQLVASL